MSDERQAFGQLHAIPSGAEWCEKRHIYIHKNYSGLVLHPINESWEAFCEGALWQASREEGEPIGEVGYMIQPNWDDPSKTKGVALVDKSLAPGTKLYTHPANRKVVEGEVAGLKAEIRTERDPSDEYDSFLVFVSRGKSEPYLFIPETLDDAILDEVVKRINTHPASAAKQAVSVPEESLTAIRDTLRLVWSRELSADDGMDEIEILIPPTNADVWIKCSDRLPNLGQRVILKSRGVVQNYMPVFDQGDDDRGMGDHFWDFEDVNKIDNPLVDFEKDCWMPKPEQPKQEQGR